MPSRLIPERSGPARGLLPALGFLMVAGALVVSSGGSGALAQVNYEPSYPESPGTNTPSDDPTVTQPVITPGDGPLQIVPTGVLEGVGVGPRPPVKQGQERDRSNVRAQSLDQLDVTARKSVGISQFGLDQIDPAGIGILTEDNEGLGRDMWRGSDRQVVVDLLPYLPMNITSPTMRDLARRLLLTAAEAPPLAPENTFDGTASDPNDLLRARVERLVAGGDLQALASLFERVSPQINDPALTRARVDTMLLTGDRSGACSEANAANERDNTGEADNYWFQVVAFCRVMDGDSAGAAFAAEMLLDMGVNDRAFFVLMNELTTVVAGGKASPIGAVGRPTPLKLAMLRAAGIDVPVSVLVQASPLLLRSIATTPNMPPALRLEAAEMAGKVGALDAAMLSAIYGGAAFADEELENAVLLLDATSGARGNALIFQAARRNPAPLARTRLLNAAWDRGLKADSYLLAAQTNIEATQALPVTFDLFESAPRIAKALLAVGDMEAATRWYDLVRSQASGGDVPATAALLELWPFMQIADEGGNIPFSGDILDLWWQSQLIHPRADRARRGALLFSIFEALGKPVPEEYWSALYEGGERQDYSMPPLAIWRGAVSAGRTDRMGEAVLLSLAAIGQNGPGDANPAVLGNVIETLRLVGLTAEARSLALEALLEAGL